MIIIKPICYVIGASDTDEIYIDKNKECFIIAADGGLKTLNKQGITPDIIVGDFDSLGYKPEGKNVIYHKPEKDDTDTMLAVNEGLERGFDTFILYGCMGGRFDHTFGNIQVLGYIAEKGAHGFIISGRQIITVIKNSSISLMPYEEGYISVISLMGTAYGVTEKGLKYSLDNAKLEPFTTLGKSNEFTGKTATISVEDGVLAIMWNSSAENMINNYLNPKK